MHTKATFFAGFATGYVLGSRAGRARYDQIVRAARSFRTNPAVQNATSTLQHHAGDALSTAKVRASEAIGEKLHDKRPAWLGSAPSASTAGSAGGSGPSAGSNGYVGS